MHKIFIAIVFFTLALGALPASAAYDCYCMFGKDVPNSCKAGEVTVAQTRWNPGNSSELYQLEHSEAGCSVRCNYNNGNATRGSDAHYWLSQRPPNVYSVGSGFGARLCFKDYNPPITYTGQCEAVNDGEGCVDGVERHITPCGVTFQTDVALPEESLRQEFRSSWDKCHAQCDTPSVINFKSLCKTVFVQQTAAPVVPDRDPIGPPAPPPIDVSSREKGTVLSLPLPLSDISVEGVIGRVLNTLLGTVGAIALLMFVWGGFSWMMAAGAPDKIAKAQQIILWATLGLIAIFSSYAVLALVIKTFAS